MSARAGLDDVVGARDARKDIRASSARVSSERACGGTHGGVLAGQAGAEEQRVVGAEGDGGAGREQRGQRDRRQVGVDAEGDVRDGTHLEDDTGRHDPVEQGGILGRADAVAEPVGVERVETGPRRGRGRAARLRAAQRAARPVGDVERLCELGGGSRVARRWTARTRPPRGRRTAPASRARVRASRGWRVRLAAMTTAMPRPVSRGRSRHRVDHEVGERGDPAEACAVAAQQYVVVLPWRGGGGGGGGLATYC